MPIRPEEKQKYPANWERISNLIRFDRAKGCCEECGIKHGLIIRRLTGDKWRIINMHERACVDGAMRNYSLTEPLALKKLGYVKIVLTTAHLDHDPTNNDGMDQGGPILPKERSNLRAWCQKCHNSYDATHRRAGIEERAARDQGSLF